jgi:hypothetical protein
MPLRKHFDESKHKRGPKGSSMGGKFVSKGVSSAEGDSDFATISAREEELSTLSTELTDIQKVLEAGRPSDALTRANLVYTQLTTLSMGFEMDEAADLRFDKFSELADRFITEAEDIEMTGDTLRLSRKVQLAVTNLAHMRSFLEEEL